MKDTALITGASSGIGWQFAHIHAERGGDLVVVARSKDKLQQLRQVLEQQYDVKVVIIIKDLSTVDSAQQIYEEVKQAGINIKYLINNAGFGGRGNFYQREWIKDLSMINVNIVALTALTRMFLPDFVKNDEGRILNVSSTASLTPGPLQAVYYATKAYVTSFSHAIAEELYDTKVTVTNLMPGVTKTQFGQVAGMNNTPMFKSQAGASPREVAWQGYRAMLQGKLNVIAGVSPIDRMALAMIPFLPRKLALTKVRKMQESL